MSLHKDKLTTPLSQMASFLCPFAYSRYPISLFFQGRKPTAHRQDPMHLRAKSLGGRLREFCPIRSPVSSRRARRRRACPRSRIAPRVGGAGCWRRLARPWWRLHVRAGTMRHRLVRPGRGVGLRPKSAAGFLLSSAFRWAGRSGCREGVVRPSRVDSRASSGGGGWRGGKRGIGLLSSACGTAPGREGEGGNRR